MLYESKIIDQLPVLSSPANLISGEKALYALKELKNDSNLIVTTPSVWKHHRGKIAEQIENIEVYRISSEPTFEDKNSLEAKIRTGDFDNIIGLGGGSAIDLAKFSKRISDSLNLIAIPTTFGSGSEVSQYAIIEDQKGIKKSFSSTEFVPDMVLLDHSFLKTIPEEMIPGMFIDAFSHAFEGSVSRKSTYITDSIAFKAIELLLDNKDDLSKTDETLKDLQAAGMLAGLVQNSASVGMVHSFANYFGPKNSWPHGVAVGKFLIPVTDFNLKNNPEAYQKLYRSGLFEEGRLIEDLEVLFDNIGFSREPEIDVHKDLAADAVKNDVCTKTNPYRPSQDEIRKIISDMRNG